MSETVFDEKQVFYTPQILAELLDVTPEWLKYNRKSKQPIPFLRLGHKTIRYLKKDVLEWFGRKDLVLKFYRTKRLADQLGCSESWLKANRASETPIPYRRLGRLVRYNYAEVTLWLKNNEF